MTHAPALDPRFCICGEKNHTPPPQVSPLRDGLIRPMLPDVDYEPRARRTDPETSHEAARSVRNLRESQAEVLALFRAHGPMTDDRAWGWYAGKQTPSSLRTRRAELVRAGQMVDTGGRERMRTGRRAIVWAVVP